MTNEEKAREILSCSKCPFWTDRPHKINIGEDACAVCFDYKSVMTMAQWKDEQFETEKQALIDKACEWWENELTFTTMTQADMFYKESMIKEFKQAMKGGEQ